MSWIQILILTLPLGACVTMSKLLNLSEPQFFWRSPSTQGSILGAQRPRAVLEQKGPRSSSVLSQGTGEAGDGDSSSWACFWW